MYTQQDLLNAVLAKNIDSQHIQTILQNLFNRGEYITCRDSSGLSPDQILWQRGLEFTAVKTVRRHNQALDDQRRTTITQPLFNAVLNGDMLHIRQHYTPDRGIDTAYLLYMAIDRGHSIVFIRDFIQLTQSDVNVRGQGGEFPVHAAARKGDVALLQLLIEHGADFRKQGAKHKTILHATAAVVTTTLLDYLVNRLGYKINECDYDQSTLLHGVIKFGNLQGFQSVLPFRPDLTISDSKGQTPLMLTNEEYFSLYTQEYIIKKINDSRQEMKRLLIEYQKIQRKRQIILESVSQQSSTLLNLANLELNSSDIPYIEQVLIKSNPQKLDLSGNNLNDSCIVLLIPLLLKFNKLININLGRNQISADKIIEIERVIAPQQRLQTLLESYDSNQAGEQATEIIKYYISCDPQAIHVKHEGWVLIHFSAYYGNDSLLQLLQQYHTDLTLKTDDGYNILHLALENKQAKVAEWLIQSVTGLIISEFDGSHPLWLAVKYKLPNVVLALLKKNVDPNTIKVADLLLLVAAKNYDEQTVAYLLEYGVYLTQSLFDDIQRELSDDPVSEKIISLLSDYLNDVVRCFDIIAANQPKQLQAYLVEQSVNLESLDNQEKTMLYAALIQKHLECAAVLMAEGAELSENEKQENVLNSLSIDEKIQLRNYLLNYFSRPQNAVISYFVSRSRFIGRNRRQLGGQLNIENLFQNLFSLDESLKIYIIPILEVIEYSSKSVDIIFDFNNDHVENINPTQRRTTSGATMFEAGKIYLGAKRPVEEVCGTLIHELCHYAMQLIYSNQCNPFPLETANKQREKSFSAKASAFQPITYKAKEKLENLHEIIRRAFTEYQPADQDAELIVRVPHLIAQFGGKGLEILKQQVPELLDYYNNVVLRDLLLHLNQKN